MGWKYAGSPYLPGSDLAHRIEGRTAWRRTRERLDREQHQPAHPVTGSEVQQPEPQPEASR